MSKTPKTPAATASEPPSLFPVPHPNTLKEPIMKTIFTAAALLASLFTAPAALADVGGSCHFHGSKPATEAVVTASTPPMASLPQATLFDPDGFNPVAQRAIYWTREMLEDGVYLLFLLKDGNAPGSSVEFNRRVDQFLQQYERNARNFGKSADAIGQAKYAFCALLDEIILSSGFSLRDEWERMPLQLRLFGDHLAGEGFFSRLEQLRLDPVNHIEALEVYYTCLLLGFQGKYLIEGSEKLGYLTARVGDEIARMRGNAAGFAPHWAAPDRIRHQLKHQVPLWAIASLFGLMAALAFIGLRWQLSEHTQATLGAHHHIVQLAPQSAHITITLP